MSVKIVTDSTCDLPSEVIKDLDITLLPCSINFPFKSYLDGVDLTSEDFYRKVDESLKYPTSSAPSLGAFTGAYRSLLKKGASAILSIHLSTKLASTYNTAVIAARSVASSLIKPFDSGQLSLGTGLIVEAAARAAQLDLPLEAILQQITDLSKRTYATATVNSLKYLRLGGRITQIAAGVGSLLQIRPVLNIHAGQIGIDLVRTSRQSLDKLVSSLRSLGPLERLSIVHTHAKEEAQRLADSITDLLPDQKAFYIVDVSPAIGVHFGPGAVGFAAIKAPPEKALNFG